MCVLIFWHTISFHATQILFSIGSHWKLIKYEFTKKYNFNWRPIGDRHVWLETHWDQNAWLETHWDQNAWLETHQRTACLVGTSCWFSDGSLIRHVGPWLGMSISNKACRSPMDLWWVFDRSPIIIIFSCTH